MSPAYWCSIPAAALAGWLITALWPSRLLLGSVQGAAPEKRAALPAKAGGARVSSLLAFVVMAAVLRLFVSHLGVHALHDGAGWGFHAWLGFALPLGLLARRRGEGSWRAFAIESGCQLVYFTAMGAVLGAWH
jgi:hypothetical protein